MALNVNQKKVSNKEALYFAILSQNTIFLNLRFFKDTIAVTNPAIRKFWTLCNSVLQSIFLS